MEKNVRKGALVSNHDDEILIENLLENSDHVYNGMNKDYLNQNNSDVRKRDLLTPSSSVSSDGSNLDVKMLTLNSGCDRDFWKIILLIFLYVLQGIPLGIGASVPYLLQARKVSYSDQALFSLMNWPFSLKLLWAPIVDSVYSDKLGRRKSWLVPTQYLIAIFMVYLSTCVGDLMGSGGLGGTGIKLLTAIFFMLNFLAATQDIAVDGWALTMLRRDNIGWVSTCNTVGQTIGYVLGNIVFLSLESEEFSNKYLRSEPQVGGVIDFSGFLYYWGITFFVSTTMVLIFKSEGCEVAVSERCSIKEMYLILWDIVRMPAVYNLVFILLTVKIGFAAADTVTALKLIEFGMPKEHLAMMAVPMIPINVVVPILITQWTPHKQPLNVMLSAMPFRLLLGIVYAVIVWLTPKIKIVSGTGEVSFPIYFYVIMLMASVLHQVSVYCMYVPMMTFFANVSDPIIGGTYMTLLNTVANLGGNWPQTLSLWCVDYLTVTGCHGDDDTCHFSTAMECKKPCTWMDGYYVESIICCLIGCLWLLLLSKKMKKLQQLRRHHWSISRSS